MTKGENYELRFTIYEGEGAVRFLAGVGRRRKFVPGSAGDERIAISDLQPAELTAIRKDAPQGRTPGKITIYKFTNYDGQEGRGR